MKRYIGVKIIHAEPATNVEAAAIQNGCSVEAQRELYEKNRLPEKDGYRVKYPDGYESWSPKAVFEEAYRECDYLTFGLAIEAMKKGHKVARKGWNGKGIHIELQRPDEFSKMTHPYIFIDTTGLQTNNPDAPKDRVPWLASQTDMLSEDWYIVE